MASSGAVVSSAGNFLAFPRYSRISFGIKGVVVKKVCWNIPWNIEGSGRQICMPKEKSTIILQILGVCGWLARLGLEPTPADGRVDIFTAEPRCTDCSFKKKKSPHVGQSH